MSWMNVLMHAKTFVKSLKKELGSKVTIGNHLSKKHLYDPPLAGPPLAGGSAKHKRKRKTRKTRKKRKKTKTRKKKHR